MIWILKYSRNFSFKFPKPKINGNTNNDDDDLDQNSKLSSKSILRMYSRGQQLVWLNKSFE